MYSFEHYIHFVDGKVIEDNLPKEVVVNDTTITFKYGEPIQLHVVVDVKSEMSLHYVFEDNVHAEVIETRHVEKNGVLHLLTALIHMLISLMKMKEQERILI